MRISGSAGPDVRFWPFLAPDRRFWPDAESRTEPNVTGRTPDAEPDRRLPRAAGHRTGPNIGAAGAEASGLQPDRKSGRMLQSPKATGRHRTEVFGRTHALRPDPITTTPKTGPKYYEHMPKTGPGRTQAAGNRTEPDRSMPAGAERRTGPNERGHCRMPDRTEACLPAGAECRTGPNERGV